jgi:hypothetical protein
MDTLKLYIIPDRPREIIKIIQLCCSDYTFTKGAIYKIHRGKYKNMKCSFNGTSLTITGSISKMVQKSNQYDVDSYDISDAIKELSCVFNTDMNNAVVKQLDYAENLIMNHEVGKYVDILSHGTTGKPFRISDETFYVEKYQKTVAAYNKTKELKNDKVYIHPDLIGKFVLRLEVRWKKNIHKLLNISALTLGMLTEHKIINKIKELWANEVLSLSFKHQYLTNYNYSTPKTLESSMASHAMQNVGGFDMVLQDLNRQKNLTANQKYRLTNKLKEINEVNAIETTIILAEELKQKVKLVAESYKDIYRMLPYTI